ncbi:MAG: ribbon-helix-helix protein, CopG family [Vulcanimicrobiaceae bacterium]
MHRIQVQLSAPQERALREMARRRKVSISALVREGVDGLLGPAQARSAEMKARALTIVGKYRSKTNDVSERHDRYFAEAIAKRRR